MTYHRFIAHLEQTDLGTSDRESLVSDYPDYYQRYITDMEQTEEQRQCELVREILTKHAEDYANGLK